MSLRAELFISCCRQKWLRLRFSHEGEVAWRIDRQTAVDRLGED